jgi:hypothetical protein
MDYRITRSSRKIVVGEHESLIPCGLAHYFHPKRVDQSTLRWEGEQLIMGRDKSSFVVFPRYEAKFKDYLIHEVVTDVDKSNCMQLILNEHYLTAPNRGMFVACKTPDDELAGCYIIDELTYGNPKARLRVDPALSRSKSWTEVNWSEQNRSEVRTSLGILWMSRIVVASKYQGTGIGEAMAASALELVKSHHPIKPRYVEIVASYMATGEGMFDEQSNIFCRAGYKHEFMSKSPHKTIDGNTDCYTNSPGVKYYFWGDV